MFECANSAYRPALLVVLEGIINMFKFSHASDVVLKDEAAPGTEDEVRDALRWAVLNWPSISTHVRRLNHLGRASTVRPID
jgi:hypothetical protein